MRITCTESVVHADEWFSPLGQVTIHPDDKLTAQDLSDSDALITRSKTRVNRDLLDGTPVRFVGTATSGTDHFDRAYLDARGICHQDAAGCNATSVAEYILFALLHLARTGDTELPGKTLGIIGAGHCGKAVSHLAQALGMNVLLNDPPREQVEGPGSFTSLEILLAESDAVTLHVPLHNHEPFPTIGLANRRFFSAMKKDAWFLNASRGEVAEEPALKEALAEGTLKAVLDVFSDEPDIDPELAGLAVLATPHIAGYSLDGRIAGTQKIARDLAAFAKISFTPHTAGEQRIPLSAPESSSAWNQVYQVVKEASGLLDDAESFTAALRASPGETASLFRDTRRTYRDRREWHHFALRKSERFPEAAAWLEQLGFEVTV